MPRYTIDFDEKFDQALGSLVNSTDATNKADVIRRAVASYKYLKDQTALDNTNVSITRQDGSVLKDVVLP